MGSALMSNFQGSSDRNRKPPAEESNSKSMALLIDRLLSHPISREPQARSDAKLVPCASAFLQARMTWDRALRIELSIDPVWSMLLVIYVRQATDPGIKVASLLDLPWIGPSTVLVRWATKLVTDGILELAEDRSSDAGKIVRLSFDGLHKIENWLRSSTAEVARLS
jgi:hypothetical protein